MLVANLGCSSHFKIPVKYVFAWGTPHANTSYVYVYCCLFSILPALYPYPRPLSSFTGRYLQHLRAPLCASEDGAQTYYTMSADGDGWTVSPTLSRCTRYTNQLVWTINEYFTVFHIHGSRKEALCSGRKEVLRLE
jgi:hypothetical protein